MPTARPRPEVRPLDPTETCASLARAIDEPLAGTAPVAAGWLAVEVPGAWGRDGLTDSALDPALGASLVEAAANQPVRLQAIRRPGPTATRRPTRRTVVLAHSGPSAWCEVLEIDDDTLARLDPAVCASPTPPGLGREHTDPVVLVCTHAKRDRCCATLGRPVADTLATLHPDFVWETSHVGGHRFAANLVVLPHGLVYGGLDVADAVEVIALHLDDRLEVEHLRGRSSHDRATQAVEVLARSRLGLDGFDEVRVAEMVEDDDRVTGQVETPAGRMVVALERQPSGTTRRLSCDRDDHDDPPAYHLMWVEPVA